MHAMLIHGPTVGVALVRSLARPLSLVTCGVFLLLGLVAGQATDALAADVTLRAGTSFDAVALQTVSVHTNGLGETVFLRTTDPVEVDGAVVIPKGALVEAKVGEVKFGKGLPKKGEVTIRPVTVTAIDGKAVKLRQEELGSLGTTSEGKAVLGSILWGGLEKTSKFRRTYLLRGTRYQMTVDADVVLDTTTPASLNTLPDAGFDLQGEFDSSARVKISKGKTTKALEVEVELPNRVQRGTAIDRSSVTIVKIMDFVLPKPLPCSSVSVRKDELTAVFPGWEVLQYVAPGRTPVVIRIQLSDQDFAYSTVPLESDWAF